MSEHDEPIGYTPSADVLQWAVWGSNVPPAAAAQAREAGLIVFDTPERETFAGTRWRRRERQGSYLDHVEITGFQPADDYGNWSVLFRTLEFAGVEQHRVNKAAMSSLRTSTPSPFTRRISVRFTLARMPRPRPPRPRSRGWNVSCHSWRRRDDRADHQGQGAQDAAHHRR